MREVALELLRCPVSGERLVAREGALVSASGKHRYELHAGRIPLFCEEPGSEASRRQQQHYDASARRYLENMGYPHTVEYNAYLDRLVEETLLPGRLGRVAELCCGQGDALALLADRIDEGVGADLSLAMLEAASARLPDARFTFVQGDATGLPLAGASFDHVLMFGGIHHVPDRLALFREVARLLRPGGRFVWREPVSDFLPWRALRAVIYRLSPALDHESERPLRLHETHPLLEQAGLVPTRWRTCGFLAFCLLMNSDVLVVNRLLRFVPGIRALTRLGVRLDEACLRLPGLSGAGLQVVGCAEKPA